MQFLKKHYEKIILCAVLLGLAAAAVWMGAVITQVQQEVNQPIGAPARAKALVPLDLTADLLALAQITNPPPVVLSGEHNLFNPVTWRRKPNGELLKILTNGPDALTITAISPLFTEIAYDHPTGEGGTYVFTVQINSGRKMLDYPKKDQKSKSGLYIIRGIKGAIDNPTDLELEILSTQQNVWIAKGNPYKQVDGYVVDMKYDPELHSLPKKHVNEMITLDNEPYKIVEITNNLVRVEAINNGKVTTVKWNGNP